MEVGSCGACLANEIQQPINTHAKTTILNEENINLHASFLIHKLTGASFGKR
jgi:hypothetical protein